MLLPLQQSHSFHALTVQITVSRRRQRGGAGGPRRSRARRRGPRARARRPRGPAERATGRRGSRRRGRRRGATPVPTRIRTGAWALPRRAAWWWWWPTARARMAVAGGGARRRGRASWACGGRLLQAQVSEGERRRAERGSRRAGMTDFRCTTLGSSRHSAALLGCIRGRARRTLLLVYRQRCQQRFVLLFATGREKKISSRSEGSKGELRPGLPSSHNVHW
jgi:hypothetical protein